MKVVLWIEVMRIGWPMIRVFLLTGTLSSVSLAIFASLYFTRPLKQYVPREKIDYVVVPEPSPLASPWHPAGQVPTPTPVPTPDNRTDREKFPWRYDGVPSPTPANLVVHPIARDFHE